MPNIPECVDRLIQDASRIGDEKLKLHAEQLRDAVANGDDEEAQSETEAPADDAPNTGGESTNDGDASRDPAPLEPTPVQGADAVDAATQPSP